jgi:formimidoylglutamate deiminase
MHCWKIAELLTETGWQKNMYVSLNDGGRITAISKKRPSSVSIEDISDWVIPGLTNAHSHAFQYAMAGLAEYAHVGGATDDFWTWRKAMYELALQLSPDQFEAIAAMVYAEMLRFGYTSVVEFHYLHHDPKGRAYANPLEMSERLAAAAKTAGIHLCIIPVYYRQGDFGKPAQESQRRFLFGDLDQYDNYYSKLQKYLLRYTEADFGVGIHSLRAANVDEVKHILYASRLQVPKHLHIAEQAKEVEACERHLGKRPVEWLLELFDLNANYNLVHATHMNESEVQTLAKTDATVVICPSTEANLGDGFFSTAEYVRAGGRWTIGSDSQIQLSPFEDLRWLDYQQRLIFKKRNVLVEGKTLESGTMLFHEAWQRGRLAAGRQSAAYFAVGDIFEGVVIDKDQPLFIGKGPEKRLSAMIYGSDSQCLKGTIRKSKWLVKDNEHSRRVAIRAAYEAAMKRLIK